MKPSECADFKPKSEFIRIMQARGFLYQCTDLARLDQQLRSGSATAYNGFDLTADSLHVGHLIPIMMLRWFQKTGNRPIVLLGGTTTRIGDPSFRNGMRPMLGAEEIAANLVGVRRSFDPHFSFGTSKNDALLVNNADWLADLAFVDFLVDVARHFSVNRMLAFDSVRSRLDSEQSLSLLEFNYMVLQAFDFLMLSRNHGCILQLGASDQWGNIINGVDLGRRVDGTQLFGLTAPLLTTASGAKMGKSSSGAVWLNPDKLSSIDFWQFWRNVNDADVGRFLRLFTELDLSEIDRFERLQGAELNEAKKRLATEVTALCHGQEAAMVAEETARRTFEVGGSQAGLSTLQISSKELEADPGIIELMVRARLASSKAEARRLIVGGAVRIDGVRVGQATAALDIAQIRGGIFRMSVGKKRHAAFEII